MGHRPVIEAKMLSVEEVMHYWPGIERDLKLNPEAWHLWYTLDHLQHMAVSGAAQVWVAGTPRQWRLMVWTQLAIYSTGPVLQLMLAIGQNIKELMPTVEATLEKFAQSRNCTRVEVIAYRAGWEKMLEGFGFKRLSFILSRPVSGTRMN